MASAPGKVILFGEHFVVYGKPAIAAAIRQKTTARAFPSERTLVEGPGAGNPTHLTKVAAAMAETLGAPAPFRLEVENTIPLGAGLGSSAAFAVAAARAIAKCFDMRLTDPMLERAALAGEKISHGTPSGIDNAVAQRGGLICFERRTSGPKIEALESASALTLVMAHSGRAGNTREMVEGVRARKEQDPEAFERRADRAGGVVAEARAALQTGNLRRLGDLMNENHELLRSIEVSTPDLDRMAQTARAHGALGAKLVGSGGGGCIAALCQDDPEPVQKALRQLGFSAWDTTLGEESALKSL